MNTQDNAQKKELILKWTRSYFLETPDMVFLKDSRLVYIAASLPFARLVGRERVEDVVGLTDFELFEDQNLARRYVEDDRRMIASGKPLEPFIEPLPERNGKPAWSRTRKGFIRDEAGGITGVYGISVDVTEKMELEQIIQAVAAAEHDYIMTANLNTNEFTMFSDWQDNVVLPPKSGKDFAEMLERITRIGVAESDVERAVQDMRPESIRANLSKRRIFSAVYRTRTDDAAENYKQMQYYWLSEDQSQLIITRSDATEFTCTQIRQQELLRSALRQAEQASNAKTDFLSKMSHEIRTPMNAIIGMNALAAQNVTDPEAASDCISKVGISARYLLTLINDILDMSRIESGKLSLCNEKIPFEEFLSGVNTVIYEQANEKNISYDSIITGFIADAYTGDAMKLQQVLVNLLGNAVKFTKPGGKVQLIVSQERTENRIAHMKFTVNDTGIGIREQFQKVMFEPFEQEHAGDQSAYGGTGLGLAITQNLVKLMGGTISVSSILGVGTEFVVSVPLGIVEEKFGLSHMSAVPFAKMSALIVDDELVICEQVKNTLREIGLKSELVTSGRDAVETVKAKVSAGQYYDIILVDWKMPDMDGIETARRIRRIVGPDVTIIIITAYEWAEIEKEAKAAGVNMLITKPLFKTSLISAFERIFSPSVFECVPDAADFDFTGLRVLLVEDHALNIEVAKRLLESKGMAVSVAQNGLEAIEAYASTPIGYFDAILMDIRMPVMDGLTATRSIRQMKKATARTIPIIAMSANAFEEDIEKSRLAGMNAHLSKPIEPEKLFATLASMILSSDTER